MKFNVIVSVVLALIFIADVFLYQQNKHLAAEIEKADKACVRDYAAVERRYKKQVNKLSADLENQPDIGDLTKRRWRAVFTR